MQKNLFIFENYILVSALAGWCVTQAAKAFTGMFRDKKFNIIKLLVSTGGMPSSHSAMVSALSTASGIKYGAGSFEFAVTFVLAVIVMRDAAGIRKDVGDQAKIINQMCGGYCTGSVENIGLKELVGHTPLQVLIGSLVGIAIAFSMGLAYQNIHL